MFKKKLECTCNRCKGGTEKMKYYVAYGSNLNREQMAHRCPDAKLVGTGMLSNYEMVFRGNKSNAVATVEPKKGMEVLNRKLCTPVNRKLYYLI